MPEDDNELSPDDILEESRDRRVQESFEQDKLAEDNDRPAAPADNPHQPPLPQDHQLLDIDLDPSEVYESGEQGAFNMPDTDSAVERRNRLSELTEDEERV